MGTAESALPATIVNSAMRRLHLPALLAALALTLWSGSKKDQTQTLQLPKETPAAVTAETRRLVFHVSPLSAKGLLSQQTRDALKWVLHASNGTVVKLRAFVAGTGDLRRVRELVSETFTAHNQPLPVVTVVQVGALPLEGAQVVLESAAVAKKETTGYGLVYISGQAAAGKAPLDPVLPLARQSLDRLATAVKAAGSEPADVLRVTCFLSSLDRYAEIRGMAESSYATASLDFVQIQRAPTRAMAECEAVARLRWNTGTPLHMLNPEGLPESPQVSQIALIGAPEVILTGSQEAFGLQDADARLAFDRLRKSLAHEGGSFKALAFASFYPLSGSIAEQVRKIRRDYFDAARPPAGTMLPFEGLPSMDASFAMDGVAVKQ